MPWIFGNKKNIAVYEQTLLLCVGTYVSSECEDVAC